MKQTNKPYTIDNIIIIAYFTFIISLVLIPKLKEQISLKRLCVYI